MKMNFSFFKNAVVSAFFLLLFLFVSGFASAQASLKGSTADLVPVLKEHAGQFVQKSVALNVLSTEFTNLKASTPNGGTAEATHSAKREFVLNAASVLKQDGTVEEALTKGYAASLAAASATKLNVNTQAILAYYADLLSI